MQKKKNGTCTQISSFLAGCLRFCFLFCLSHGIERTWQTTCLEAAEKKKIWVICCCFRALIVQKTDTRGSKRLQTSEKRNWQAPLISNLHTQVQKDWKWKSLSQGQFCESMDYTVHGILQARILEWVTVPFFRGSSQPRDRTQVSQTDGRLFTSWATGEAQEYWSGWPIPVLADLPDPRIEPGSPTLQVDSLPTELRKTYSTEKIWKAPKVSSCTDWWRSFPALSQFVKNGRRSYLSKCVDTNTKLKRKWRNKQTKNMLLKKENRSPKTYHKEVEV